VSGPKALVSRIVMHMQVSVLHASFMSQVVILYLKEKVSQCFGIFNCSFSDLLNYFSYKDIQIAKAF